MTVSAVLHPLYAQIGTPPDSGLENQLPVYRDFSVPIDPALYFIRPAEKLRVTFVGSKIPGLSFVVDPEGYIADASLGRILLSGKSLGEAREILTRLIRKSYTAPEIHITIDGPRLIPIRVAGHVERPGTYLLYTSQRASEAIQLAGGVSATGSRRLLRMRGGPQELAVDLDRAQYLGESELDPPLYAGDQLIVPAEAGRAMHVVGSVVEPRVVEWVDGDDVNMWISLAGGVMPDGDLLAARFLHIDSSNGTGALFVPSSKLVASPTASIYGAVKQPGVYAIQESDNLASMIDKAGGKAEFAGGRVVIFRRAGADLWGRPLSLRYPIVIYADKAMVDTALVIAEDSVLVPPQSGFVRVTGGVNHAGAFPFARGKSVRWYIDMAGDILRGSKRTILRLVDSVTGTATITSPDAVPFAGAEIIVEEEPESR